MLHSRFQILSQLKIILKSQLKHIIFLGTFNYYILKINKYYFLIGWFMQHAAYLFIERSWEKDQQRIQRIIKYYKSCQSSISVRINEIFPMNKRITKYSNFKLSKKTKILFL
jgi:1-acyl-sn-glycerol-3-phosphate acyltransferase